MLTKLFAIFVTLCGLGEIAMAGPDEDAVRLLLHSTFDGPDAQLVVEPVVVAGDHAIAGWSQGDLGGRALLRQDGGRWSLILCSGDGIKSAEAMRHAGVPTADAMALSAKLAETEGKLPAARLALFAKFEGTMMMNADGSHPPIPHATSHGTQHAQHSAPMHGAPLGAPTTFSIGAITVETPWLRATPQGAQVAGGYMRITNKGAAPDRLVGGTLDPARRFEIHEMTMVDNVMRMRPLPNGLEIKPGETVELKPGGYHIMGMDLQGRLAEGETVKGTLRFEKAGSVDVVFAVRAMGGHAH